MPQVLADSREELSRSSSSTSLARPHVEPSPSTIEPASTHETKPKRKLKKPPPPAREPSPAPPPPPPPPPPPKRDDELDVKELESEAEGRAAELHAKRRGLCELQRSVLIERARLGGEMEAVEREREATLAAQVGGRSLRVGCTVGVWGRGGGREAVRAWGGREAILCGSKDLEGGVEEACRRGTSA